MPTYRATVTIDVQVTPRTPLSARQLRDVVAFAIKKAPTTVSKVLLRDEPSVSIEEPWCAAIVRRNTLDGQLYACQQADGDSVHRLAEACEMQPCDRPEEHHEYLSPGWDAPVDEVSA